MSYPVPTSHANLNAGRVDPALHDVRPVSKAESQQHHLLDAFVEKFSQRQPDEAQAGVAAENDGTSKRWVAPPLDAFIIDGVLTQEECGALTDNAELMGYTFWNPDPMCTKKYRNADTVEITHQGLADFIWKRMARHCQPVMELEEDDPRIEKGMHGRWEASGINPTLLFVRYEEGGHFSPHTDGWTIVDFNTRSLYSVLVYLNTCPDGGATRLLENQCGYVMDSGDRYRWDESSVVGRAPVDLGTALVFFQSLPHEGEPVGDGCTKIIIRTDVMYKRVPPLLDTPEGNEAYRLYKEAELLEADDPMEAAKLFRRVLRVCPEMAGYLGV